MHNHTQSDVVKSPNLLGAWFAPRWVYFNFYQLCRRRRLQTQTRYLHPSIAAWNALGAVIAIPWLTMLLAIDHYIPFLQPLGHMWAAVHLPGSLQQAKGYALTVVGLVTGMCLLEALFCGRYNAIMSYFSDYDRTTYSLAPGLVLGFIWIFMGLISVYAVSLNMSGKSSFLLIATIANAGIFIATEILFRTWWRWWRQRGINGRSESKNPTAPEIRR